MEEIVIDKISLDMINFYKVDGNLNLESRKISINMSFDDFNRILGISIRDVFYGEDLYDRTKNMYILGKNGVYYSCLGCIFGYKTKDMNVTIYSVPVDLILENVLSDTINLAVTKVTFKTYFIGHSIHAAYIQSYEFKYSRNYNIKIDKHTNDNFHIDISIESKSPSEYKKMSGVLYHIVEMIKLIFGDIPKINEIVMEYGEENVRLYLGLADKYKFSNKKINGGNILGCITIDSINKDTIKKFERFRKDTGIIYDLFMINTASNGYKEIQNCNLIQIMEGLYKTINKISNNTIKLKNILPMYFKSKNSNKILSKRDKRKVKNNNTGIFIYKAVNHRNYLSHLNLNSIKSFFYKDENIYAYWKLSMALRIFMLEYLSIEVESEKVLNDIEDIEKWAKKNKLRFRLK